MHKKLEAELIQLAHQILKINNQTDINELRDKTRNIYENLSVLSFIDNYFVDTPEVTDNKEAFLEELTNLSTKKVISNKITPKSVEETQKKEIKVKTEQEETDQLVKQTVQTIKTEAKEIASKIQEEPKAIPLVKENATLDEEMKHSIPADVAADMFEKAEIFTPKTEETITLNETKAPEKIISEAPTEVEKPKVNIATKQEVATPKEPKSASTSLNDRISNQKIQVGLNDRIAFVKHLFNFSQEDFNRVLSQLNTFTSELECKNFIENRVKPDYDWNGKEEYEARLITLVERKFK